MTTYNDGPLFFRAAHDAAQIEREGDYHRAAKAWIKAERVSRNYRNQEWCENRADFCKAQAIRDTRVEYELPA